ncbi:hypothetical protein [uncultured Bradyrhizobium sp.]|uniref:hypothetical protein n=1 Tax=Bradyrhizobium sp. TaxID=376 RepID=UPI0026266967|nr:hypothetical protein [uncultured Bradyrhizobium sp.]
MSLLSGAGATLDLRTTSIAVAEPMQPWQMICGARTSAMLHARHLRGGDCLLDFLIDFPRITAVGTPPGCAYSDQFGRRRQMNSR